MSESIAQDKDFADTVITLNHLLPTVRHGLWSITVGRFEVRYSRRSSKNLWGRFGGGWNWAIGVQVGPTTVYFQLLIAELFFTLKPKRKKA